MLTINMFKVEVVRCLQNLSMVDFIEGLHRAKGHTRCIKRKKDVSFDYVVSNPLDNQGEH